MAKNSHLPFNGLRGKPLTEREITVLLLYSRGASIAQIAARIFKSQATVRADLQKVIYKTGSRDITCALVKAQKLRLV